MSIQVIPILSEARPFKASTLPTTPVVRLLRLSVTDRCNFRCRYCMPARGIPPVSHSDLLSLENLAEMVNWLAHQLPVQRVKFTGGEPLVRKGIEKLVASVAAIPNISEVSLTTNGSLLAGNAWSLKACGLSRVSVSLDSLDENRFADLSRGGKLKHTLKGIEAALKAGLTPLKLNTVLQRSSWQEDVPQLLDFASDKGLEIRFIELMRMGTEREWADAEFIPVGEVQRWLGEHSPVVPLAAPAGVPAQLSQVHWNGRYVRVGWISPRSHPFCRSCERVRLDARGRLRRCLMDASLLDLLSLRKVSNSHAREILSHYLAGKFAPQGMDSQYMMSQIGG